MLDERVSELRTEHDNRKPQPKTPPPAVKKQPEPQPKPAPSKPTDNELLRVLQARYSILREHKALRESNGYQTEIAKKKEAAIRAERKQLIEQNTALGERPLMFGKANWDWQKKYIDDRYATTYNQLMPVMERIKELTEAADPQKSMEAAIKLVRAEGFTEAQIALARNKASMEKAEIIRAQQERTVKQAKEALETQQKAAEAIKKAEAVKSTAEMQKTLPERLRASMGAFVQWIKDKGGIHKEINQSGTHTGKIAALDDLHAVQHLGRGTYAIHRLDQLDVVTEIKYNEGRGLVASEKSRDRGMSM
jgi:hypothetical protein